MLPSARRTLVTGASRPVGLEVVKQCLERGDRVVAAARNPARVSVLADLRAKYGTLDLVALDPADAASVADAVPMLESIVTSIDLLVVTPGEPGPHERTGDVRDHQLESISATDLVEHYRRHAVAPLLLVRTLLPMLNAAEGARVLFIHTEPARATKLFVDLPYAVSASRAALETLVRAVASDGALYGVAVASGVAGSDAGVTSRDYGDEAIARSVRAFLDGLGDIKPGQTATFIDGARASV